MEILVLGGTEFVGRAVVEAALGHGWKVTVFHRGRHPAPEGAAVLLGDRLDPSSLASLSGRRWDAVIDTWSGAPSAVARTARTLADHADHYVYVSSRSVYDMPQAPGSNEQTPLVEAVPDEPADAPYAQLKRGAEIALEQNFAADRTLLVRAGLILGRYENIGRLPWWLNRIAQGGRVLAPGSPDTQIQYVDVVDLADWTLHAIEQGLCGPYDIVSPPTHATMGELLTSCVKVTGSAAELVWTPAEKILSFGVQPWTGLPIWLEPREWYDSMHQADPSKALAAGLTCRTAAETVADTWAWLRSIGGTAPQRPDRPTVGISRETEARILAQ